MTNKTNIHLRAWVTGPTHAPKVVDINTDVTDENPVARLLTQFSNQVIEMYREVEAQCSPFWVEQHHDDTLMLLKIDETRLRLICEGPHAFTYPIPIRINDLSNPAEIARAIYSAVIQASEAQP